MRKYIQHITYKGREIIFMDAKERGLSGWLAPA